MPGARRTPGPPQTRAGAGTHDAQQANATPPAFEVLSASAEETSAVGEQLGRLLRGGDVVALHGELGSGKTTFVQGIAQGMRIDPRLVKSPTFVIEREYAGPIPLIHIDGYRLAGAPSVAWLGLEQLFDVSKVTVIEWAERFSGLLPDDHLVFSLQHMSANRRRLSAFCAGTRSQRLVAELHARRTTHNAPRTTTQEAHGAARD